MRVVTCFAVGRGGRTCDGAKQRHHVVPKQGIRRAWKTLAAAQRRGGPRAWRVGRVMTDGRNMLDVCWAHHQLVEGGSLRVELTDVPTGFWAFVTEYGLYGELPRHLMEEAA